MHISICQPKGTGAVQVNYMGFASFFFINVFRMVSFLI